MTAHRLGRRIPALATVVVVILLAGIVAVVIHSEDGPGPAQASLEVDGRSVVTAADGTTETVTGRVTVSFGDVVAVEEGTAVLELAAGQRYELRAGAVDSEVEVGAPPILLAGDALVSAGFPARMTYETTTVSAQGALKLVAGVPSAVAYAGRARISGAGPLDQVMGLRQVVLTPSATPEPLVYDATDAWDRRFLGAAIAFGERLEAIARGYTGDLQSGDNRSVNFFESIIPALAAEREFTEDLLDPQRPAGETLIGAAIAVQGRIGTFRERWEAIFAFREAGAAWGLVALDQGVSSAPVLDTIELAIAESPLAPVPPPQTTAPPTTPTQPPITAPAPTDTTTTTTTAPPTAPPPPPPEQPPPPPDDGLLGPLLDPADDLLDDVLDVLGLGDGSSGR